MCVRAEVDDGVRGNTIDLHISMSMVIFWHIQANTTLPRSVGVSGRGALVWR
jgi:hypothetical protein